MFRIMVLDRGFVVAAHIEPHPELAFHWLATGRTIRRWGTIEGLSQLCKGPLPETVLDAKCQREIPWRSVIEMLVTDEKAWSKSMK